MSSLNSSLKYHPHGRSLIGGESVEPAGATFESHSRIDGSYLGTFVNVSADQARSALKLARGAFHETAVLSPRTPDDHAGLLMEVSRAFEARLGLMAVNLTNLKQFFHCIKQKVLWTAAHEIENACLHRQQLN